MMMIVVLDIVIEGVLSSAPLPLHSLKDNECISSLNLLLIILLSLLLVVLIDATPLHNVDIECCSRWCSCLLWVGARTSLRCYVGCQLFIVYFVIIIYVLRSFSSYGVLLLLLLLLAGCCVVATLKNSLFRKSTKNPFLSLLLYFATCLQSCLCSLLSSLILFLELLTRM